MKTGSAIFTEQPRRIEDLKSEDRLRAVRKYSVVKIVDLSLIDFENFITDMMVERDYLEEFAPLCDTPEKCILIKSSAAEESILVVPTSDGYVKMAALLED